MSSVLPRIRVTSPFRSVVIGAASIDRIRPPSSVAAASLYSSLSNNRNEPRAGSSTSSPSSSFLWLHRSRQHQWIPFSSTAVAAEARTRGNQLDKDDDDVYCYGPRGDLFSPDREMGRALVGRAGCVRRTFGPRSNAEAMLTCGGEALAAHASFDPDYLRAQGWIRQHAVGPAVLSPVLVSGLVGALVEAAFPQSVPDAQSITILRPIIVGVEVVARIEVTDVVFSHQELEEAGGSAASSSASAERKNERRQHGYTVHLKTLVSRERDALALAEGSHSVWIPDYLRM